MEGFYNAEQYFILALSLLLNTEINLIFTTDPVR